MFQLMTESQRAARRRQKRRRRERHQLRLANVVVYLALHPAAISEYQQEMAKRRLLRWRLKNHVRRKRLMSDGSPKRLHPSFIERLYNLQRARCPICRHGLANGYQIDHVVPLAAGGSTAQDNIQLLCVECNQAKWHRPMDVFMREKGFLL
jgi:5-methylcytosine-specific restriction endonuclease McrA